MTPARQTQPWKRRELPLLSNSPGEQDWFRCGFYCPRVIYAKDRFRMWFVGSDSPAIEYRGSSVGYAESTDGISWDLFARNPIVSSEQIPWPCAIVSTPWVLYDEDEDLFKMWCGTCDLITERRENGYAKNARAKLAYATSIDGLDWTFHPEPLIEGTHAPCVRRFGNEYRMWINDRTDQDADHMNAYAHVFEYRSRDGIDWKRLDAPVVAATGKTATCVYPCVMEVDDAWYMWHIGHLKDSPPPHYHPFEIFCDTSTDGNTWQFHHESPAFAAADDVARFDWKFVSTPSVVLRGDDLYLYYAASNFDGEFNRYSGRSDGVGMHFGLATMNVRDLASIDRGQ